MASVYQFGLFAFTNFKFFRCSLSPAAMEASLEMNLFLVIIRNRISLVSAVSADGIKLRNFLWDSASLLVTWHETIYPLPIIIFSMKVLFMTKRGGDKKNCWKTNSFFAFSSFFLFICIWVFLSVSIWCGCGDGRISL